MNTERPGVLLQMGTRRIVLHRDAASDLPSPPHVETVHVRARCSACSACSTFVAAPKLLCHDDDHVAYVDDYFESRHGGTCTGCGALLHLRITYCITTQTMSSAARAELGRLSHVSGCTLASPPAP